MIFHLIIYNKLNFFQDLQKVYKQNNHVHAFIIHHLAFLLFQHQLILYDLEKFYSYYISVYIRKNFVIFQMLYNHLYIFI